MGFGNFLKGIGAQLIPGGKTYGSYNPKKKKKDEQDTSNTGISVGVAKPTQRITVQNQQPKPQQPQNIFETLNKNLTFNQPNSVVPVLKNQDTQPIPKPQPGMVVKPTIQPQRIAGVTTAPNVAVRVPGSNDSVRRSPGAKVEKADPNIVAKNTSTFRKVVSAPVLSAARVGTGLVQGGAGLYDLATPGKGQNRVTQATNQQAEELDRRAKEIGVNKAYKALNVPGEVATYFAAPETKVSKFPAIVDRLTKLIGGGTRGRRIATQVVEEALDPRNIAQEARLTGRYTGQDSAHGTDITPEYIAQNAALSLGGAAAPAILRNLRRGAEVPRALDEVEAGIGAATAGEAANRIRVPVRQGINVDEGISEATNIPVRSTNPQGPLIRELTGDATQVTVPRSAADVAEQQAADRFANQNFGRPDDRIEGVTPRPTDETYKFDPKTVEVKQNAVIQEYADFLRSVGEGNGVDITPDGRRVSNNYRPGDTKGKRMTKADWREEAERQLKNGKANPELQKVYNDLTDPEVQSLIDRGEQPNVPVGSPISVKSVNSIPVQDQVTVPQNLPETPGTVRVTTQTSPMKAKSEAVAAQNAVTVPVSETPVSSGQPEGFAPTGETARGKRGNVYEKASQATEAEAGTQEMAMRSVDDLLSEVGGKESFTPGDRRRISAAIENIAKSNPDDRETRLILKKLQSKSRTELGQALAMIPRVIRRSATSDTLTNRWESKISKALNDPRKMTDADWNRVQTANDKFTLARDRAAHLEEQFKRTGSEADFKAWEDAHNAARKADTDAKFIEAAVAQRVLKGEKGAGVNKVLDDIKKEADVNTMDSVTASMLSGTATGFRNTLGTEIAGVENRIGANIRAKITKALFNENVGGFDRKGARMGRKVGFVKLGTDAKRRAEIGGKNPVEWAKNWATTINSGGESSLQSQVYSRLGKYYKNQFADQGLKGKELDMRMRHALLTDPDGMGDTFLDATMKSSGLTGMFQKGQTIEKAVVDYVGKQTDSKTAQALSRLVMRIAVGFPTATTNFIAQSGKRLTAGLPSYFEMGVKLTKGDKAGAALAFDRGLKETGSGLAILGLGAALGKADMISGPYPTDPEERDRWEREGISENSIKIGDAWYPIPQGAGMLGLPLLTGAAIGREGDSDASLKEMYNPKNLSKLLPTDQLQGFLNMTSGNGKPQDLKNSIASAVRAGTPAGSLFNQLSKSFDETKNDTTTKDFWHNVIDQIVSGIPGQSAFADIPDKLNSDGVPIKNPNPAELAFGAASTSQLGGEERTQELQGQVDSKVKTLSDYGVFSDTNFKEILSDDDAKIYDKAASGGSLTDKESTALQKALVKGVSETGSDTAYLERGQYDTNLSALKLKKKLMEEDKTTKPSDIKNMDTAIKRGEIYKENDIPYELISAYQGTGVEEWRKMGDPEDDEYDLDRYNQLWAIDQAMTKEGVSYKKGSLDKQKYTAKKDGKGRGKGRSRQLDTSFGTLKAGSFAPSVQQYDTIDAKAGNIPMIRVQRPNIVHKISSSG